MLEFLSYLYDCCGVGYSFLFAVSFLALFVGGRVILFRASSRKAVVVYGVMAFAPLLIGVLGTMQGYLSLGHYSGPVEVLEIGYHTARVTTYVGGSITLLYLMLGLVAFLRVRRDALPTLTASKHPA